jgi:PKD repeat protein
MGNPDGYDVKYIQAVGKAYSRTYDFETVTLLPDGIIDGEVHQVTYNPTFDDTRVFKDFAEVERSTHITISADSSRMAGMKNPVWKIVNESNPEINDIYYNSMWLTYIFQNPGYYSIELKAEDTYGNTNVTKRNMIKVK